MNSSEREVVWGAIKVSVEKLYAEILRLEKNGVDTHGLRNILQTMHLNLSSLRGSSLL